MEKVALVTGSSKGIGKSIAINLASEGYFVYVTFNSDKVGADTTITEINNKGGKTALLKLNVLDESSVQSAFKHIKQKHNQLNVLINNAGIEIPKPIEKVSLDEWQAVVDTKITGNFLCTKYALPLMKQQTNANLIFIISSLGDRPDPNYPAYCVGTAGSVAFMKAMSLQLGKYGIRTNGISPGTTRTPMWDDMGGDNDNMWESFAKNNPMGRVSTPQDIANAVIMLINDKSDYLNGNIIYMNGGSHLR